MKELKIYFTSDLHGYVYPTDYTQRSEKNIGLLNIINEFNKDKSKFLLEYLFENGLEPSNENLSLNINCPIYENYKFMKKSIKHNSDAIVYAKMDTDSFEKLLKIAKRKDFNFSFENLSKVSLTTFFNSLFNSLYL